MSFKRERRFLFVALSLLIGLVTWVRTATVRDTYQFVQQEREFNRLQDALQEAKVRWSRVTAPQRLEVVARDIGLQPPRLNQRVKWRRRAE